MQSRLKSLELQGYKTFASRALFEFPSRITAVVGPNGAGKSNIADSARWVLGEQAYSLLRARKTEDMIFSGSDQRPKSGMASATITFDNEDGWLPIDFSEVSVTRRAYRDGQNEYLINGQKVRLKEINELLSSSGLSERTYTIIGQGLVDTALSLRPDERRRFFEEAAGIGLYRTRRDEAINRLDATRRNLERVQDILGELAPRLTSLEKQARKAREFEQVQADLHVLLREWYGFHWHRVQADVVQQRMVVKAQEERLSQARNNTLKVDSSISEIRKNLNEMREKLSALHTQSAVLHSQRELTSRDLAVMDERKKSIMTQTASLQTDQTRLEEEQQAAVQRLETLKKEVVLLENEVTQAQDQLEKEQNKLKEVQKGRSSVEIQLTDVRRSLLAHETKKAQSKAQIETLKLQANRLIQQQESLRKKLIEAEPGLEAIQKEQQESFQRLETCNQEIEKSKQEVDALHKLVQSLEEKRRKIQDERANNTAEISRLKAQLDVVIQAEKALAGWGLGARSVLESVKQGKLRGGYRTLVSELEIPEQFEKAVSAVLGEYLEAIVLENGDTLENALMLIENEKTNRVMFILPTNPKKGETITIQTGNGVVGKLDEQISSPGLLKPVLEQICGSTYIVDNRQTAYRLTRTAPENARFVTLAGEVFTGKNTVIAGETSHRTLLSRPRMMKDLTTKIEELTTISSHQDSSYSKIEEELAEHRQKIQNLQDIQQKSQKERERLTHRNQELTLQLGKMQQLIDWQKSQAVQSVSEHEKTLTELDVLEADLAKMMADNAILEEQQTKIVQELDSLSLDEFTGQVNFWKTNLAVAQKTFQDAQRRLEEYNHLVVSNAERIAFGAERIAKLHIDIKELEAQRSEALQIASTTSKTIATLQIDIEPNEQALNKLEQEYDQHLSNQMVLQQALSTAERYHSQAQIELSRKNEELASLQRKVGDDFGLVEFQYTSEITGPTPLPMDNFVEQLPQVKAIKPELEESINRQRSMLKRMGAINLEAQQEYMEVKTRHDFLVTQVADLHRADEDLRQVIHELDELMQREFRTTFDAVATEFKHLFTRLFGGGSAKLVLVEGEKPNEDGIDIEARLPGRREQGLALLSGGERSLTAVALIFALLKVSPTPFCIMDEVDAMLDEANVGRFCELLQELSKETQFIIITHNRNTVQIADVIYGVTMGRDSSSQIISLRIDQLTDEMVR